MGWIEIRKEYESTEISLSDLAVKHGLKYPTVKSRKQREGWQKGASSNDASNNKKDASKRTQDASKGRATKRAPKIKVIVNNREIESGESPNLTEKQILFVAEYLIDFNATRAAMVVGYSKKTASQIGYQLLQKTSVQNEIKRQTGIVSSTLGITSQRVLLEYLKIAFVDITEYVQFGQTERFIYEDGQKVRGDDGEYLKEPINYINLKNHDQVDGALISEIKEGPSGISIKLHDKMKALEKLERYLDLLPDHHKRRIEDEKLKLEQAKFEADKLKASGGGGVDENIQKIQTLASLLNNPAPNRNIRDFENDE